MSRNDHIELQGIVTNMTHGIYTVSVEIDGKDEPVEIQCSLGGKLRKNFIRVLINDRVTIEVSPYDLTRGTITYRMK